MTLLIFFREDDVFFIFWLILADVGFGDKF